MAVYPITVETLDVGAILGHSNGDGWGCTDNLFSVYANSQLDPNGNWQNEPDKAFWKNIYVFTSEQPFPAQTADTNISKPANAGNGAWLEMTIANPINPGDPHPHGSPYDYANNQGACYPRVSYEAWPKNGTYSWEAGGALPSSPLDSPSGGAGYMFNDSPRSALGVRHGIEIPLMQFWRNYVGDQVGLVKVAFSSSFLNSAEAGTSAVNDWLDPLGHGRTFSPTNSGYLPGSIDPDKTGYYCYWTPSENFDWHPASGRLYRIFEEKMNGAKAALPSGTKMNLKWVLAWLGDNDSGNLDQSLIETSFERNVRAIINRIRTDAVKNGWTQLPAEQIRIIWPKVHYGYQGPETSPSWNSTNYCNDILAAIAAEDEFFEVVDSWLWKTLSQDRSEIGLEAPLVIEESTHIGTRGYYQAAQAVMESIVRMDKEPFDSIDLDDAPTVSDLKTRVREYYGRGRSNSDIDDDVMLQHLNGALYHCFNQSGDSVWWMRRRKQMSITSGATSVHTFPKYVYRVLRIEGVNDPTYPVEFEMIGHSQNGKLQINTYEQASGTHWVQYISRLRRMTADAQIVPVPDLIAEWIVVEACKRLASSAGDEPQASFFAGESMMLQRDANRAMGQVKRQRKIRLRTQRRRFNMRYRGGYNSRHQGDV